MNSEVSLALFSNWLLKLFILKEMQKERKIIFEGFQTRLCESLNSLLFSKDDMEGSGRFINGLPGIRGPVGIQVQAFLII